MSTDETAHHTRKTFNLTGRAAVALARLASKYRTETDSINSSLVLHATLLDFTGSDGTITVEDPVTGNSVKLVLL